MNFHGANLQKANFSDVNLRKTDFRGAYLRGATFESNETITDAIFSWNALKYPVNPPIDNLEKINYLKLLAKYKDTIKKDGEEKPNELIDVYNKLGIKKFEELLEEFEKLEKLVK